MRRRAASDEAGDVNVTPLLDIVFIMLIFFIVTATFVREQGIDVNTPQNNDSSDSKPPPSLVLAVLENGLVQVNNGRTIDPFSVKNSVSEFIAAEEKGVVLVSAAPDAPSGVTVVVMDQARQGGATGRMSVTLQQQVQ